MKKPRFHKQPTTGPDPDQASAADELDHAVSEVLRALRRGQAAHLPGVGVIMPGRPLSFKPEGFQPESLQAETAQQEGSK